MLIVDTHILVWMDSNSSKLGPEARKNLDQALSTDDLAVSAISYWEVAMLQKKGRLCIEVDLGRWRQDQIRSGLREIPVDGDVGIKAANLDSFHGDPADRIIVATSLLLGAKLLTADRRILDWDGPIQTTDGSR